MEMTYSRFLKFKSGHESYIKLLHKEQYFELYYDIELALFYVVFLTDKIKVKRFMKMLSFFAEDFFDNGEYIRIRKAKYKKQADLEIRIRPFVGFKLESSEYQDAYKEYCLHCQKWDKDVGEVLKYLINRVVKYYMGKKRPQKPIWQYRYVDSAKPDDEL